MNYLERGMKMRVNNKKKRAEKNTKIDRGTLWMIIGVTVAVFAILN